MTLRARLLLVQISSIVVGFPFLILAAEISPWFVTGFVVWAIGATAYVASLACPSCGRSVMVYGKVIIRNRLPSRCPYCNHPLIWELPNSN
jgi:hypothetical protein